MKTAAQYLEQGLSILSGRGQQYGSNHYQICFVENQKGKTIAAYRATGYAPIADAPTMAD